MTYSPLSPFLLPANCCKRRRLLFPNVLHKNATGHSFGIHWMDFAKMIKIHIFCSLAFVNLISIHKLNQNSYTNKYLVFGLHTVSSSLKILRQGFCITLYLIKYEINHRYHFKCPRWKQVSPNKKYCTTVSFCQNQLFCQEYTANPFFSVFRAITIMQCTQYTQFKYKKQTIKLYTHLH